MVQTQCTKEASLSGATPGVSCSLVGWGRMLQTAISHSACRKQTCLVPPQVSHALLWGREQWYRQLSLTVHAGSKPVWCHPRCLMLSCGVGNNGTDTVHEGSKPVWCHPRCLMLSCGVGNNGTDSYLSQCMQEANLSGATPGVSCSLVG